jgi:hypothetical protein
MLKILFVLLCVGSLSNQSLATSQAREEKNENHREYSQRQMDHAEKLAEEPEKEREAGSDTLVTSSVTDVTAEYAEEDELSAQRVSDSRGGDLRREDSRIRVSGYQDSNPSKETQKEKEVRTSTPRAPKTPTRPGIGATIGKAIGSGLSQVTLSQLVTLGEKVWNYVIDNKPNAQFQTIKASIVPDGITDWTQLSGWTPPVVKVYHVQFKDALGINSGSFDYRITFVPGGSYQARGKFLGEIEFTPMNIKLATGRSLNVTAELSAPLNFGTPTDPVAAAQLLVSWTTPTLTHYQMQSAEYFIYGSGDIQDLSSGSANE